MDVCNRCIKNLAGCQIVPTGNRKEVMMKDGFHRVPMRGDNAKKDCCGVLHVKSVTDVL